jgi:hypothetical protein
MKCVLLQHKLVSWCNPQGEKAGLRSRGADREILTWRFRLAVYLTALHSIALPLSLYFMRLPPLP